MSGKTVCVSGYFNPIHKGHLEYLERAKALAGGPEGRLIVIVNNDAQARLKKGYTAIDELERVAIVRALRVVDDVVLSVDADRTVCATLRELCSRTKIDVFANGGDQTNGSIPEAAACHEFGVELVDGLGNKIQSSSAIIQHIKHASGQA